MILKRQIAWASVVLCLFVGAVLSLLPNSASAHVGHDRSVSVGATYLEDPTHADEGHPGHCHGGTFCSGLAVMVVPPVPPTLTERATRVSVSLNPLSDLPVAELDPPPPRILF